jgi:hypothetical protein
MQLSTAYATCETIFSRLQRARERWRKYLLADIGRLAAESQRVANSVESPRPKTRRFFRRKAKQKTRNFRSLSGNGFLFD